MPEASQSSLTPATAPRDLAALTGEGMFKLRMLLVKLNKLSTEDEMMAWHALRTNEARAAYVLEHLKEWDKTNSSPPTMGGFVTPRQPVTSATAAVQQMIPQAAPPNGAGPAMVDPAALAAAGAATVDKPKTRRDPKTTQAAPSSEPAQVGMDIVTGIAKLLDAAGASSKDIGLIGSAVVESHKKVEAKLEELSNRLDSLDQLLAILFTMELSGRQEATGASTVEILQAALADRAHLTQLMQQAASGKAK